MSTESFVVTVQHVLPALNIDPMSLSISDGFVSRVLRSGKPGALTLDNIQTQLVFVGSRTAMDPSADAFAIAVEALESLPSRQYCEQLVVVWLDSEGEPRAAAFNVSSTGEPRGPLGVSWSAPEDWDEPTIDFRRSPREALDDALHHVEAAVRNQDAAQLKQACQLVDHALSRAGGEGQIPAPLSESASRASWETWLDHYKMSIIDEWNRITHSRASTQGADSNSHSEGRLAGLDVFISYARPEATILAWPVRDALLSCGARVWFDHDQIPDKKLLDTGLADTIASCDAYVLCASDEFFERAGYATQELCWALERHESEGKPSRFLVVTRSDVTLPSIVRQWPRVLLTASTADALASAAAELLENEISATPRLAVSRRTRSVKPSLLRQTDKQTAQLRAKHIRCYDWFDVERVVRLATRGADLRRSSEMAQRLLRVGSDLDWDGTLRDIADWPQDPLVRDTRLRIASARAIAGTYWPLVGELGEESSISEDVEYLATSHPPVIDWPIATGWDDYDRKLTLRYHAGVLRALQELLRRGLFCGLLSVPSSKRGEWERLLTERRTECYDAILSLRASGKVTWHGDPPTWDGFFRSWSKYLLAPRWREPVPSDIQLLITAFETEIAAVAADTGWYASRYSFGAQQLRLDGPTGLTSVVVYSSTTGSVESGEAEADLRIGLVGGGTSDTELRLAWHTGESSALAPTALRVALGER